MVNNRAEHLKKRMQILTESFVANLPSRLEELQTLIVASLSSPDDHDTLFSARMSAHKIAGGAGTFGFDDLGNVCRSIENLLDPTETDLTSTESKAALRRYSEALARVPLGSDNELAEVEVLESFSEDAEGSPEVEAATHEHILVLDRTVTDSENLVQQLKHFGLQATCVTAIQEVESYLSNDCLVILCADLDTIRELDTTRALRTLVDAHEHRFSWIAMAEADGFEQRIDAVRRGAVEFFIQPVDVSELMDKIRSVVSLAHPEPIHVLIVDDDIDQVSATAYTLQQAGMITSVASNPAQVFSIMIEAKPELVIMDMYMPECTGIELARLIRQQKSFVGIPIIFLSVESDTARHIDAMSEGGDDFLVKPVRAEYLVGKIRMRANRAREMRFFMEHDSLTGLLNHSHLKQRLNEEIHRASRIGTNLTFAMIDLDHFKSVNDTYGHLTGDRVLKSLSRMLQDRLRKTDTIGRYGGEEFGVILFHATIADAREIMNDLRESFAQVTHHATNGQFRVTFSCGLAAYPELADAKLLGDTADKALYRAKESGRNRVVAG